ncbi:hypothetical protein HT665_04920 [Ursidibacter maritimus]|uniref:Uncharacterized protein n=1 Tax=Ursidibacter maritimus TaxID=1331689 RepID=A0A949T1J5_9PAST|nr:hypothetical protein [Ursidibacter maritimus]MBV6524206.1 hypothetical protein [Ursidibacter maritimus]MBV6525154.1 hypothetical protein [Ursidibacter maritimus]MBV6528417.1 hypothetical protein [Ursidibacter maritimus]MBV6530067.1 hypothetical protein [Ursidibacter maritimus]MBV6531599.1 hypothetical protein [Ursidibacter maritimus]
MFPLVTVICRFFVWYNVCIVAATIVYFAALTYGIGNCGRLLCMMDRRYRLKVKTH